MMSIEEKNIMEDFSRESFLDWCFPLELTYVVFPSSRQRHPYFVLTWPKNIVKKLFVPIQNKLAYPIANQPLLTCLYAKIHLKKMNNC